MWMISFPATRCFWVWQQKQEIWKPPGGRSLHLSCEIQTFGSESGVNNMKWFFLPCVNTSGCSWWCFMGWIFRWHTLGPSAPPEHRFNSTTYPSVVADRGHSVASSAGCFQDGARISQHLRRFLEPHDEFAALRRPPQSTEVERQLHIMYICVMVSCQHGSACQRNVCSTQWVCATKDWRGF